MKTIDVPLYVRDGLAALAEQPEVLEADAESVVLRFRHDQLAGLVPDPSDHPDLHRSCVEQADHDDPVSELHEAEGSLAAAEMLLREVAKLLEGGDAGDALARLEDYDL
jgi:hypothetical protein